MKKILTQKGPVPEKLEKALEEIHDCDRLMELVVFAADVNSVEEFEKGIM